MKPQARYRFATIPELQAGGLCLDSVGHVLEVGHELTCMCCGATGIVEELTTEPESGWNFDGSQWVRTPQWLVKLREEAKRACPPPPPAAPAPPPESSPAEPEARGEVT